jgi:6-phosphogluconolactonase
MDHGRGPRAYIGTYSDAIYCWSLGEPPRVSARCPRPSFVAVHPSGRFLYAVAEEREGMVIAWEIQSGGESMAYLNEVSSAGSGPCHIALHHSGTVAVVCNYAGGSVAAIRVRTDGSLGELFGLVRHSGSGPRLPRQSQPHPRGTFFAPDGSLAVVPDLGLDKLFLYRFDGGLRSADPGSVGLAAGAGPRHIAFHPGGAFVYALCELNSTVVTLRQNESGFTAVGAQSVLPPGFSGENIAAAISINRSGRFLYCSNRGADTIAVFSIGADGHLEPVEQIPSGGTTPRHITIDESERWLFVANQGSDSVAVFRRDAGSGRLFLERDHRIDVAQPACVALLPDGNHASAKVNCG